MGAEFDFRRKQSQLAPAPQRYLALDASFFARSALAAAHKLPEESSAFVFALGASDVSGRASLAAAGTGADAAVAGSAEDTAWMGDRELTGWRVAEGLAAPLSVPWMFAVLVPAV